jgi:hypothetical protein
MRGTRGMGRSFAGQRAACVVAFALVAALQGCADHDVVEVTVSSDGDDTVFTWEGGDMHTLVVLRCTGGCRGCNDEGYSEQDSAESVWYPREIGQPVPDVRSPTTYGVHPSDAMEAVPLESGETYYVEIERYESCKPDEAGCEDRILAGCAEFTAP